MNWAAVAIPLMIGLPILHLWWRKKYQVLLNAKLQLERREKELQTLCENTRNEAKAQRNALFDSMIEGVLLLDKHSCIQHANQSILRLLNQTRERVVGKTIMESIRIHELEAIIHFLEHKTEVMGTEINIPGKRDLTLEVNAVATKDAQNNPTGFIMVFHDLTRIRKLENTRREFVANASHELRTPISMIKGFAETLFDGAKKEPDTLDRFLQTIIKHADRLTSLVEDLLSLSKLESHSDTLDISRVKIYPLVNSIFEELSSRAADRNITLINEIKKDLELPVDENRIRQVFFNLIDNAIKYSGNWKTVKVGSKKGLQNFWEISVADNGPGIPEEAQGRIFERFYRVDKSRSRESGDTGLGLAIVKHIVQLHGGSVWCDSKVGKGSTFNFTLHSHSPQSISEYTPITVRKPETKKRELEGVSE
jgi:two-component system phosphate regulon sensor histidine kinase PhoR